MKKFLAAAVVAVVVLAAAAPDAEARCRRFPLARAVGRVALAPARIAVRVSVGVARVVTLPFRAPFRR
ncbi:MAG: hypothetical protein FJ271_14405 [Planctomycetes bacterium]|nr:hypothetical protein [Planctomycetota bacterium]